MQFRSSVLIGCERCRDRLTSGNWLCLESVYLKSLGEKRVHGAHLLILEQRRAAEYGAQGLPFGGIIPNDLCALYMSCSLPGIHDLNPIHTS